MTQQRFSSLVVELAHRLDISAIEEEIEQTRTTPSRPGVAYGMVVRIGPLKTKMYQEKGHQLPHLHVDYGRINHVASYSIDPASVLEGALPSKHHGAVIYWIRRNKETLLELWETMQSGGTGNELVADLRDKA